MSQPTTINHTTVLGDDYILIWIDAFLTDRKAQNLSKHTLRFYKNSLKIFTDYCESQSVKNMNQITPNFLREFILFLDEKGHNSGGINVFFRSIKAFLNWYESEVDDFNNPIYKVKSPKVIQEPITGISKDEFEALLVACKQTKGFLGVRDYSIISVLMDTGVRAEELCNIELEDVNLPDGSIQIKQGKGRKPRFVFIGKSTRKQIRKYLKLRGKDGTYLFTNRSRERLVYSALRQIVRRLCTKAGIKDIGLHNFRRGFTLECLRNGMDLLTISRLLGHTNLTLLARYAKQTTVDLKDKYISVIDD